MTASTEDGVFGGASVPGGARQQTSERDESCL